MGVDLVLNSLTSPGMVAASLSLMCPAACMAEIGKRNIWSAPALAAERQDLRYNVIAIDMLPAHQLASTLASVACMLARGDVAPIAASMYSLGSTSSALRHMSMAKHVCKVVVGTSAGSQTWRATGWCGSSTITGGLGSLGALVTEWALQHTATHLNLQGRSGRPALASSATAALTLAQLMQSAACVSMQRADMA